MSRSPWPWLTLGGWLVGAGCARQPTVPDQPTWADVQPILRGNCAGCHGSTAAETGLGYRLDLYDVSSDICGEAASAVGAGTPMAAAWAPKIATDITPPESGGRERMPPLPGPSLLDWERETLLGWTKQPIKGGSPPGNRPATIQVFGLPSTASDRLTFTALVSDPDGDEAIAAIRIGDVTFAMNRSGSFAADLDMRSTPVGTHAVTGYACDGWTSGSPIPLGSVDIER